MPHRLQAQLYMRRLQRHVTLRMSDKTSPTRYGQTGPGWRNGTVGAALAFRKEEGWIKRGIYLGKNKEAFDVEVFAIMRAVRLLEERGESGTAYTVISDSQAAIARVQHDGCGPAQALARATIAMADGLCDRDNTLTIRWTPSHARVCGNERAGQAAKRVSEERDERADPAYLGEASLSYLTRKTTERRSEATSEWIGTRVGQRRRY